MKIREILKKTRLIERKKLSKYNAEMYKKREINISELVLSKMDDMRFKSIEKLLIGSEDILNKGLKKLKSTKLTMTFVKCQPSDKVDWSKSLMIKLIYQLPVKLKNEISSILPNELKDERYLLERLFLILSDLLCYLTNPKEH